MSIKVQQLKTIRFFQLAVDITSAFFYLFLFYFLFFADRASQSIYLNN